MGFGRAADPYQLPVGTRQEESRLSFHLAQTGEQGRFTG